MRGLVLSGGGSKGAYATGALYHLLYDLQLDFQILTGVSVGAINAAFLAQFSNGQEQLAAQKLRDLWSKLDNKDVYKRWWPFGQYHALWKLGFFDSSPLHQLIQDNISLDKIRASGKHVSIGLVSLTSGKYKVFNQTDDHFIDAVIASASFPCLFEPVKIGDEFYTDGGVKTIAPIMTAIDLGATEICAIVTSPETRDKKFFHKLSIIDIMTRSFDLYTEKIMSNDIEKVQMYNKLAEKGVPGYNPVRLDIIRPQFNLIEDFLDFTPAKIQEMMQSGYSDVKTQLIV